MLDFAPGEVFVALLVDRNTENAVLFLMTAGVALRKESVDRNKAPVLVPYRPSGRSPQGERG